MSRTETVCDMERMFIIVFVTYLERTDITLSNFLINNKNNCTNMYVMALQFIEGFINKPLYHNFAIKFYKRFSHL